MPNAEDDYGFIQEPCFFCGHENVLLHNEHYIFCPHCTALYTDQIVQEGCEHIKKDAIVMIYEPGLKEVREKAQKEKAYLKEENGKQYCSLCGKECVADGWQL